jgi:hypothetical protein
MEIPMLPDVHDAIQFPNGLRAERLQNALPEERATYKRWLRAVLAFYCVLFLTLGAIISFSSVPKNQTANLSVSEAFAFHTR